MQLYDEASLGRVEAALTTRQAATEFKAWWLRLAHLWTLQVQKQPNIISAPAEHRESIKKTTYSRSYFHQHWSITEVFVGFLINILLHQYLQNDGFGVQTLVDDIFFKTKKYQPSAIHKACVFHL